ncbi:MAG: VCBS repeat-containing protein [Deltaproteobacteria bacterium]|nr:VCBS repeat-containing protein [Nannocystaceae bacterium]
MLRATSALGVLAGLLLAACYAFPEPDLGRCGNSIIEAGEDCDDDGALCSRDCRRMCAPECPQHFVCGSVDDICRAPSGAFADDPIRIPRAGTRWLEVGDLDGDERDDVIAQFDDPDIEAIHLGPQQTVSLVDALGFAAVGDLDADGRAEVVIGHVASEIGERGLSVVRETKPDDVDRVPATVALATLRTEHADARLLAIAPVRERVLELVDADETRAWSSGSPGSTVLGAAVPVDAETLAAAVAIGELDEDGPGCTAEVPFARFEAAFASVGDDVITLVSSCGGAEPFGLEVLPAVALPAGERCNAAGTFFADANGDGHTDLLTQGESGAVLVAYGVGDRSFHSSPSVPDVDGDGAFAQIPLWVGDGDSTLLVVADFDRDDRLELVTTREYVAAPEDCDTDCGRAWDAELQHAITADLNDDGELDVVALAGETISVQLAQLGEGEGDVDFKSHELPSLAGVGSGLGIGDFDRDTVDDVALLERVDADGAFASARVTALFGGPLSQWRLESFGPFVDAQSLVIDGSDTMVVRTLDAAGRPSGAFIRPGKVVADFGFAVRQPVIARAAGATVVASLALDAELGEHLVHYGFADGSLSPHDVIAGASLPELVDGAAALVIAAPLAGDPATDELVVLGTTAAGGTVWVASLDPSSGSWSVGEPFAVGPGFARHVLPELDDDEPQPPPEGPGSSISAADVDGDGDIDVLATTDERVPQVVLLRNDAGVLSADSSTILYESKHFGAFEIAQLEPWHPTDDGAPRWLVGGDDGVGLATLVLDEMPPEIAILDQSSAEATALAAADVDGDGLLDMVIATEQEIRIHLAQERIPGG